MPTIEEFTLDLVTVDLDNGSDAVQPSVRRDDQFDVRAAARQYESLTIVRNVWGTIFAN